MTTPDLGHLAPPGTHFAADPYPVYALLRERGPVHRVPTTDSRSVWLVLGHDEVRTALTDPRLRNDIRHSSGWEDDGGHAVGRNMLQTDPPHHTRLRRLVAREFTGRRVESLRPRVRRIAEDLLDAVSPQGRTDLVASFAAPLPVAVICELLGVPAVDRAAFHRWSTGIVHPADPASGGAAAQAMTAYLTALVAEKRKKPGGDLLSSLAATAAHGEERLSPEELLGMAFLLLVAGHETTAGLISGAVHALLTHPDQLGALRADPSLVEAAVEETLRHNGPVVASAHRFTAEPVEIGGTVVPAGESVLAVLASASRDPRRFPDPDRFDIRRDARGHSAFGHGVHHCLGAPLARMEAAVALESLLERFPDLALDADPAGLEWYPGMLRGLRGLPVRYGPREPGER
ncbi:cytochrome P450 [Streptomyces sp. DH37]|uniref:cytochrome P450 family protein n=1 Tax=Streptomyces sp. DH37 TaxID=3040122 RepID=UPI0024411922|nr:cytochrome P450 [Streptomyces sp. DH37]MDG9703906.1 cytochrome P450 [Streptomyces sp. DH37]